MSDAAQLSSFSSVETFKQDVIDGLLDTPKRLPCKYFYDQRGSALFDQICELDEYYLTRTEQAIMNRYASEMGKEIGRGTMLVEYGSGSSVKTRILLESLIEPAAYVPVDISHGHLHQVADQLRSEFTELEILPVTADFTTDFELPQSAQRATHAAVYFPGSTIGNFEDDDVEQLLLSIARVCGAHGGLLIGIDLVKENEILESAYNDRHGVTAEFNLNLLHRIDRELDSDIDVDGFEHVAFFNEQP